MIEARATSAKPGRLGRALACGHFLPEEAPEETRCELSGFFAG
jgi:hypothetical protein